MSAPKSVLRAIALVIASTTAAQATAPASAEMVLCAGRVVATGVIVGVKSLDCRLTNRDKNDSCSRQVLLDVRLSRFFRNRNRAHRGQILRATAQFENGYGIEAEWGGKDDARVGPNLVLPWTGKPVGTAAARAALLGKRYIFQFERGGYPTQDIAMTWPTADLGWVKTTLAAPSCNRQLDRFPEPD
jgi:hypothetical protein